MNFEKYEVYNNEEYRKLLSEKSILEKETTLFMYKFIGIDGKVEDTKKYTFAEYSNLSSKEKNILSRYTESRETDFKKREELEVKSTEVNDFYIDFRSKIKEMFINDFATENEISVKKTKGLLRYSLNLIHSTLLMIESSDIDFESSSFTQVDYDYFMNDSTSLYTADFKRVCESMEDVLDLFNIMGEE